MKLRYKIIIAAICVYFGVFFGPVIASNVYCDFIAQEMCTSRITGVVLPPFNMISHDQTSGSECFFEDVQGVVVPCGMDHFEWPFPPREIGHSEYCEEICSDEAVQSQGAEVFTMPDARNRDTQHPPVSNEITVVLGVNNTVYWRNLDEIAHTFTTSYGDWSTGFIRPGEHAHVTFNQTGVYEYHDNPGPWIQGRITVIDEQLFERSGHDLLGTAREEFQVVEDMPVIEEEDIPVFFEIQLMELGVDWEMPDRVWENVDFEVELPARICSYIVADGADLYLSTVWQDEYSLSDMVIQENVPDDCVKLLPVSEFGR